MTERKKKNSVETITANEPAESVKTIKKTRTTRRKNAKTAPAAEISASDLPTLEPESEQTPRATKAKTTRRTKKKDEGVETKDERQKAKDESVETQGESTEAKAESQEAGTGMPETKSEQVIETPTAETVVPEQPRRQETKFVKPTRIIHDLVDLSQAPVRQIVLSDQQIQQLTLEQAEERHLYLEQTLARVLDYDIVITDTNIWLELLVGKTSSNSDPRINARLQFERQLEFISKMIRLRKCKFIMMAETYEEIDRFATQQEPTDYQEADFTDQTLCLNVAARLAKRLILSQQRENRLRIEGIGAESHHSAFADPAIIRRTVEFFAQGKKVLLITNDASVAIRSMGLCDDLQRFNNIDDETWEREYVPLRPMACTFDDLKMLDGYTRQYHFIMQAAGKGWMEDIPQERETHNVQPLKLWLDAFRPGDRHRQEQPKMPLQQPKQQNQPKQQKQPQSQQQPKQQQKPVQPQSPKQVPDEPKAEEQKSQQQNDEQQVLPVAPAELAQKDEEPKPKRRPQRRGGRRKSSKEGDSSLVKALP